MWQVQAPVTEDTVPTVHVFLYGSVTYFSFGRIRIRLFDGQGSLLYHFAGYTGTHPTFRCDEYGTDPTFRLHEYRYTSDFSL